MPSRPARLKNLTDPDAVHIVNQLFAEYAKRIDDVAKAASSKRIASKPQLVFGTIPANTCVEATVNILGASANLVAHANPTLPLYAGVNLSWSAYVSAKDQVRVRVCNPTVAGIVTNTVVWNILVA